MLRGKKGVKAHVTPGCNDLIQLTPRRNTMSFKRVLQMRPFDLTPAPNSATRTVAERRFALWTFLAALIVAACTVMILDTSITPEQRIAVFEHSGLYP
jgi:hypothetical protein